MHQYAERIHKCHPLTHDACAAIEHDGKDSLETHHRILGVVSGVIWLDNEADRRVDRQTETDDNRHRRTDC